MKTIQLLLCLLLLSGIADIFKQQSKQMIPVEISGLSSTTAKLEAIGAKPTDNLVKAIDFAASQNDISSEFIIALASTESGFDERAVSSKGYKGLMQIPQSVYYPDANIIIGTRIFREKMTEARNDLLSAIMLYKGYPKGSAKGLQQAKKVIIIYKRLLEMA